MNTNKYEEKIESAEEYTIYWGDEWEGFLDYMAVVGAAIDKPEEGFVYGGHEHKM